MRDFRDLLPGSFRGLRFHVDKEEVEGGRHVATHEYVRAESHDTEDLGKRAATAKVTAYLASDVVDAEASALFSACSAEGPGFLTLPAVTTGLFRCSKVKRSSEKDKLGLIAFELEFVAAGGGGSFVETLFDLAASSAAGVLGGLVAPALRALAR